MKNNENTPDSRIGTIASRQHGLISFEQALRAGLHPHHIGYRVRSGRWARVSRGVFRLAGAPPTSDQRHLAATLSIGGVVAVSHLSAAALAGMPSPLPPIPHVTVERGRSVRSSTAVVHLGRLPLTDVTIVRGVPVTTIARTLADCAAIVGPRRLQGLVDHAMHHSLVRPSEVPGMWDRARRAPGRHGEVKLRKAFEGWTGSIRPGSPAERRLRRQVVAWGFPEPELQISVVEADGTVVGRIDMGWRTIRLGIEYDSAEFHGPTQWAADEARHTAVERLGWTLLHASRTDLLPGEVGLRNAIRRHWRADAA